LLGDRFLLWAILNISSNLFDILYSNAFSHLKIIFYIMTSVIGEEASVARFIVTQIFFQYHLLCSAFYMPYTTHSNILHAMFDRVFKGTIEHTADIHTHMHHT
jgi:hypothetical protein